MEEEIFKADNKYFDNESAIKELVEYGRQRTIVTIDDILRFLPEAEKDFDLLEDVLSALSNAGIRYTEDNKPGEDDEAENDQVFSDSFSEIDIDDSFGMYLKEVSMIPLLSADEEVELTQRIEKEKWHVRSLPAAMSRPNAVRNYAYILKTAGMPAII